MISIVTETISCLTKEDCEKYGVRLISLKNICGGEAGADYIGRVDLKADSYTLPPTQKDYYEVFASEVKKGNQVLCLTLSQKLSNAYLNAVAAAKCFKGGEVRVMDSRTVACGVLFVVRKARELESQGLTMEQIVSGLREYRSKIYLHFYLPDMEAIKRAKRISALSFSGKPILNQKPVFCVENGGVRHIANRNTVIGCIRDMIQSTMTMSKIVVHYTDISRGRDFAEMIARKNKNAEILLREITASLHINIGGEVLCIVGEKA